MDADKFGISAVFVRGARAKPGLGPRVDCSGESGLCHRCPLGAEGEWAKHTTAQLGLLRRNERLKEEDGVGSAKEDKKESLQLLCCWRKRVTDVSTQTDAPLWR